MAVIGRRGEERAGACASGPRSAGWRRCAPWSSSSRPGEDTEDGEALRGSSAVDRPRPARPARPRRAAARQGARRTGRPAGRAAPRARRCSTTPRAGPAARSPSRRVRGLHLIGCCRDVDGARRRRSTRSRTGPAGCAARRCAPSGRSATRAPRARCCTRCAATGCTSATPPRHWSAWATASRRPCSGRWRTGTRGRAPWRPTCAASAACAPPHPLLVTLLESHEDPTVRGRRRRGAGQDRPAAGRRGAVGRRPALLPVPGAARRDRGARRARCRSRGAGAHRPLKGLRGWAWGSADFRHYEEIVRGIGGVVD